MLRTFLKYIAGVFAVGAVLIVVALFAIPRLHPVLWIFGVGRSTMFGWHTDQLRTNETVKIIREYGAAPAASVIEPTGETKDKSIMYRWSGFTPAGDISIRKGTKGLVKIDPAWDEDSCDPDRPIAVELIDGDNRGKVVAVARKLLRP